MKVADYFFRFEFQERGSLHMHIILWMVYDSRDDLLKLISCRIPPASEDRVMNALVRKYQKHQCSKRYCKKGRNTCRFNFGKKKIKTESKFANEGKLYDLARNKSNLWTNPYNATLLKLFCSNMDIQIITSRSFLKYITKYVTKPDRFVLSRSYPSIFK